MRVRLRAVVSTVDGCVSDRSTSPVPVPLFSTVEEWKTRSTLVRTDVATECLVVISVSRASLATLVELFA